MHRLTLHRPGHGPGAGLAKPGQGRRHATPSRSRSSTSVTRRQRRATTPRSTSVSPATSPASPTMSPTGRLLPASPDAGNIPSLVAIFHCLGDLGPGAGGTFTLDHDRQGADSGQHRHFGYGHADRRRPGAGVQHGQQQRELHRPTSSRETQTRGWQRLMLPSPPREWAGAAGEDPLASPAAEDWLINGGTDMRRTEMGTRRLRNRLGALVAVLLLAGYRRWGLRHAAGYRRRRGRGRPQDIRRRAVMISPPGTTSTTTRSVTRRSCWRTT